MAGVASQSYYLMTPLDDGHIRETRVCLALLRLTARSSEEVIGCSREVCRDSYMNEEQVQGSDVLK